MAAPAKQQQQQQGGGGGGGGGDGGGGANLPALLRRTDHILTVMAPQIAKALPAHLERRAERFVRIVRTVVNNNEKLLQCSEPSLRTAILNVAAVGLEPDPQIGHIDIIPRWDNKLKCYVASTQTRFGGYIELARRSGQIVSIDVAVVYQNDHFVFRRSLQGEVFEHEEAEGERGEWVKVYALARFQNGGHHIEIMRKEDVLAIRDTYSTDYQSWVKRCAENKEKGWSPPPLPTWLKSEIEMAKKTVVRRAKKYWPMSIEDQRALAYLEKLDDEQDHAAATIIDQDGVVHERQPAAAPAAAAAAQRAVGSTSRLEALAHQATASEPPTPPGTVIEHDQLGDALDAASTEADEPEPSHIEGIVGEDDPSPAQDSTPGGGGGGGGGGSAADDDLFPGTARPDPRVAAFNAVIERIRNAASRRACDAIVQSAEGKAAFASVDNDPDLTRTWFDALDAAGRRFQKA